MHSKISHTLVLCASFCIATGAVAESADDVFIEEIVVTATHRETALMDTPQAISAVSGELIEQLGYIDMKDLFKNIPGLNMTEGSSSSNNRYVVRGVSSQSGLESYQQTSAAISVYLDDIPMTSAQGPARQFAGNLFDIDRVEVLKGPQGTLFGEGSVGGTIRFIQNDPQLNTTSFKLKAGVNSVQDSDDLGNRIDGMFNFPLGDNAAVRLTAFHDETAGYIDKLNTFEDDVNTETADGGRLAVLWAPNDRLTLDATIYYSKMETEGAVLAQLPT
ncbi:MAG: TonB-dependent receptor plug domain-containing protein [Gammaproteobacteria bacterium]|nr:TonB-dependent receptor plug domain-containing protein [Gammaproteobacteria bacterium]